MANRAPSHRARSARDVPAVRSGEEIAADISPVGEVDVALFVDLMRDKGLEWTDSRAAAALEALYWIGAAREQGQAWTSSGQVKIGDPSNCPDDVLVPSWLVREIGRAWINYRDGKVRAMDEAFGLKSDPRGHPADRRRKLHEQVLVGMQTEDVKQRGGLQDEEARASVAVELGHSDRKVSDDHRRVRPASERKQPPRG